MKLWLTMLFHFPLVWLQLPRGLPNDLGIGVEVLWAGFEVLQGMSQLSALINHVEKRQRGNEGITKFAHFFIID